AIALERLKQLDPMSIEPIVDRLVSSKDAKVRMLTAQMLFRQRTVAAVRRLAVMLADVNPDLRLFARESLIEMDGEPRLRAAVRKAAMTALVGDHRHARQQAIILVGAIDHEPAADRLVQFLDDDDTGNCVLAAWSLRKLAVPATAEAIREKLRREIDATNAMAERNSRGPCCELRDVALYDQLTHLLEALGRIRDRSATPLLSEFLPRPPELDPFGPPRVEVVRFPLPRAAALWALALCYADDPNEQILQAVTDRFTDFHEADKMRQMAAIGLGRLKSKSSIQTLRSEFDPQGEFTDVGQACGWALQQITGEDPHVWKGRQAVQRDWFLEPLP
ncbi:MAG: hypothetical protein OES79_14135, partial [Planctomycetota bacterium]|nr:hypothetical protein [Planctomycetota bacterium]